MNSFPVAPLVRIAGRMIIVKSAAAPSHNAATRMCNVRNIENMSICILLSSGGSLGKFQLLQQRRPACIAVEHAQDRVGADARDAGIALFAGAIEPGERGVE